MKGRPSTDGEVFLSGTTTRLSNGDGRADITSVYEPIRNLMRQLEAGIDRLVLRAPAHLADKLAHALKGGGKRLRPGLVLLSGSLYPGCPEALVSMALGFELLHTATLVHDDTIDNAASRRGMPTVNRLWGSSNAVFLGDYLCGCSALVTAQTGNPRAMSVFSRALSDVCRGAIAEHVARTGSTRGDYFSTISRKTASLFTAATESGAVLSQAPDPIIHAMKAYGYNLGMAFQMIDDIHDYRSDIPRGNVTLPGILVLEGPENRWVGEVLEKDPQTGFGILVEMIEDSCVLNDCYRIAEGFCSQACEALERLPDGPIRESLGNLVCCVVTAPATQCKGTC